MLPDQSSLVPPCKAGRADAAALTALSIADMASKNEGVESTKPFGEVAGKSVVGHGAVAFRKEDTDLYEAFNAELKKFIGSDEHLALVTPIGFGEDYPADQDDRRALRRRVGASAPCLPPGGAPLSRSMTSAAFGRSSSAPSSPSRAGWSSRASPASASSCRACSKARWSPSRSRSAAASWR